MSDTSARPDSEPAAPSGPHAERRAAEAQALGRILSDTIARLDPEVITLLGKRPERATTAITVALTTVAMSELAPGPIALEGRPGRRISPEEARRRLDARTATDPGADPTATGSADESAPAFDDQYLSSEQMAARLDVAGRETVLRWHRAGKLIGFERNRRGLRFPAAQLVGGDTPLDGLETLKPMWEGDDRALWSWLTTPSAELAGELPLIELRHGRTERVIAAARAYEQGDYQ